MVKTVLISVLVLSNIAYSKAITQKAQASATTKSEACHLATQKARQKVLLVNAIKIAKKLDKKPTDKQIQYVITQDSDYIQIVSKKLRTNYSKKTGHITCSITGKFKLDKKVLKSKLIDETNKKSWTDKAEKWIKNSQIYHYVSTTNGMLTVFAVFVFLWLLKLIFAKKREKSSTNYPKQYSDNSYNNMSRSSLNRLVKNIDTYPIAGKYAVREIQRRLKQSEIDHPKSTKEDIENKKLYGQMYERYVGKQYEAQGYVVEYRGIELKELDGGIDLIATKDDELLLIQCKYWTQKDSITHKMIKEFYGNCHFYMDKNSQNSETIYKDKRYTDIACIYAVPSIASLESSAHYVFQDNKEKCRYKIVKMAK